MVAATNAWRRCAGSWRTKRGFAAGSNFSAGLTDTCALRSPRGPAASCHPSQSPATKVGDDLARRVVAGRAGDTAPRVRAGAAHVQARERTAVVAVAEHRARG